MLSSKSDIQVSGYAVHGPEPRFRESRLSPSRTATRPLSETPSRTDEGVRVRGRHFLLRLVVLSLVDGLRSRRVGLHCSDAVIPCCRRRIHLAGADDLAIPGFENEIRLVLARGPLLVSRIDLRIGLHRCDAAFGARFLRVALARQQRLVIAFGLEYEVILRTRTSDHKSPSHVRRPLSNRLLPVQKTLPSAAIWKRKKIQVPCVGNFLHGCAMEFVNRCGALSGEFGEHCFVRGHHCGCIDAGKRRHRAQLPPPSLSYFDLSGRLCSTLSRASNTCRAASMSAMWSLAQAPRATTGLVSE